MEPHSASTAAHTKMGDHQGDTWWGRQLGPCPEPVLYQLAEQQKNMLDHLITAKAQMSQQLSDHLTQAVQGKLKKANVEGKGRRTICILKMTTDSDPEASLYTFERSERAAEWPQKRWAALFIPCLVGPAQQVVDTVPPEDCGSLQEPSNKDMADYGKVRDNPADSELEPEAYRRHLQEVSFGPHYFPCLVAQKIMAAS